MSAPPAPPAAPVRQGAPLRRRILFVVKLLVSAALLVVVLRRADPGGILAAMAGADPLLLLLGWATLPVGVWISARRWRTLLRAQGVDVPLGFLVRSFIVGTFFNQFLPSTFGGDTVRAWDSSRLTGRRAGSVTAVVVDRLLGLLVLLVFALGGLALSPGLRRQVPMLELWVAAGALGLAALVLVAALRIPAVDRVLLGMHARLPGPVARPVGTLAAAFAAHRDRRTELLAALGWSLALQTNVVLFYVLIARALGITVPLAGFFLIVPVVLVVMMLPVSINGIGLRENAFAFFLGLSGVAGATAVALAWLAWAGQLIEAVVGGVLYALRR